MKKIGEMEKNGQKISSDGIV